MGKHTTHTYHKYDEGRIKEAEVKETIRLREIELEEAKFLAKERTRKNRIKAIIILGIIAAFCFLFGFLSIGLEIKVLELLSEAVLLIGFLCLFAIAALIPYQDKKDKNE